MSVFQALTRVNNEQTVARIAEQDQYALVWEFADGTDVNVVVPVGTPFDQVKTAVKATIGTKAELISGRDTKGNPLFKGKGYFPKRKAMFGLFYKGQVNTAIGGLEMKTSLLHKEEEFDNLLNVIGKAVEIMESPEETTWVDVQETPDQIAEVVEG